MTIDKQALLVSKAKASVFTMEYISQFEASDIDSDYVDLRFEVDGTETGTIVSIVDECGHAAQIITALLDELEHYKSREERVTKLVLDNSTSWDVLYEKLEAAEKRIAEQREYYEGVIADGSKRIAELEAKLETADKLQDSAFRDGLKAGFSYGQTDDQSGFTQCMSAYSPAAGIKVKGE
ncbi:ead/Ea22-like family protein [Salmonella enterica]|nr:ead/Ea22-like family protein [Salmonella enterica]EIF8787291.1 ead/Ea22-like family protein [Salmonella enterica]ELQ8581534.1 ead/Ea22-like family protein [Salmonella enterica]